jgi:RHS repeat-associated protein
MDYLIESPRSSDRSAYDPFGDTLRSTGPRALANPWRFSTKYTDQESGWLYYGYRYYAPKLGRWVSRDPIEVWRLSDLNQLQFSANDPISSLDILGLVTMSWDFSLTRHPTPNLGETSPWGSQLKCECLQGCTLRCSLDVSIVVNIKPGLESMPPPLDYGSTYRHEMGHARAFAAFFLWAERAAGIYEGRYGSEATCAEAISSLTDMYQLHLASFTRIQRTEPHPDGWDHYDPSVAELNRFIHGSVHRPLF